MYNVKILKYPSGWQYRVYNQIVGVSTQVEKEPKDIEFFDENGHYLTTVTLRPSGTICENPFTGEIDCLVPWDDTPPSEFQKAHSAKSSANRTINRVYHLSRSNSWEWFVTLTFDPEKVDSFDYESCVKKLNVWLKHCKRYAPDMKYIVVPEKHKSGRFHFHGLFADCDGLDFTDSGHCTKDGQPIYNIGKYRLGWSTATKVTDNERVTKYISKYITKDLCAVTRNRKRYWASRNLNECECEELVCEDVNSVLEYFKENAKHCSVVGDKDGLQVHYFEMGVDYE